MYKSRSRQITKKELNIRVYTEYNGQWKYGIFYKKSLIVSWLNTVHEAMAFLEKMPNKLYIN